jgi:sterol desaturase/sphingolipid hydroxylase (fatty acid hydroxylase superfamily)
MPVRVHRLVSALVFPGALAFGLGLAFAGLGLGLPPLAASLAATVVTALLIAWLEHVLPYTAAWGTSHGDVKTDVAHTLLSNLLTVHLLEAALFGVGFAGATWLARALGSGVWPSTWPILLQLALALPIAELGVYWVHRLAHEQPLLWRLHAVHHSAPRLYWLNAGRFHPLDTLAQYGGKLLPLAALGAPDALIALFLLFTSIRGMLQHSNLDTRCAPLNWIFAMPELHRWHHVRALADANHNYGTSLILWDVVFGTRYLPKDRTPPTDTGLEGMPWFPQTFGAQLCAPFRWQRRRG